MLWVVGPVGGFVEVQRSTIFLFSAFRARLNAFKLEFFPQAIQNQSGQCSDPCRFGSLVLFLLNSTKEKKVTNLLYLKPFSPPIPSRIFLYNVTKPWVTSSILIGREGSRARTEGFEMGVIIHGKI